MTIAVIPAFNEVSSISTVVDSLFCRSCQWYDVVQTLLV